jgi:hypothetical protein
MKIQKTDMQRTEMEQYNNGMNPGRFFLKKKNHASMFDRPETRNAWNLAPLGLVFLHCNQPSPPNLALWAKRYDS